MRRRRAWRINVLIRGRRRNKKSISIRRKKGSVGQDNEKEDQDNV